MKFMTNVVFSVFCASICGETTNDGYLTLREGALGKYVYRVVDDEGCVVSNAQAHVWFRSYGRPQDKADWIVETDTNGMFTVEHRFNEKFSVGIDKEGYYHSHDEINYLAMPELPVKDGRWQPYGMERVITLKRIRKPQQMNGAAYYVDFKIPAYDVWLGFDFDRNQFLAPYGQGVFPDVLLRFTQKGESRYDYHMSMEVSFTNQMYAGAYVLKKDLYSAMKSVYNAETNAMYVQSFAYVYDKHAKNERVHEKLEEDEYLVFRTRTEVDAHGQLMSARYGKIYGPWHYVGPRGMSIRSVYFNQMPNNTNLEDCHAVEDNEKLWGRNRGRLR